MNGFFGYDFSSIIYLVLGLIIVFGIIKGLFKLVGFVLIAGIVIYLLGIIL